MNGDGLGDVLLGSRSIGVPSIAELFLGRPTGNPLGATPDWTASSSTIQPNSRFGHAVAGVGDANGDGFCDVLVGAPFYDNDQNNEGRVFLFPGGAAGPSTTAGWATEGGQAQAQYGYAISGAGDVNGDGYSDVLVSASLFDNGQMDEGRVSLYLGSAAGLQMVPSWSAEGDQAGAGFGISVSSAGDVNGDGYGDVLVGAWTFDNGEIDEGRAFLYLGSSSGLSATPAWTVEGDQTNALLGEEVSSAGDVNGDGFGDVLIGAFGPKQATLHLGSTTGLATPPAWTFAFNQLFAVFPRALGSAGDVNGDGYGDVIVTGNNLDNGQTNEGMAFVFKGGPGGLDPTPAWTGEGDQAEANYGFGAACAGDVNGDGYSDVVISAYLFDNGETDEGRIYVYHGSPSGLVSGPASWTIEGNQANARFGSAVSTAGDVNGDGYSDVLIGAVALGFGDLDDGKALLYLGSASGLASSPAWSIVGPPTSALGHDVASAGDVNGDGYGDVIVSAPWLDDGDTNEGGAFVYYGNGGSGGWLRALQQRTRNDTRPLSLYDFTGRTGLFHIRAEMPASLASFSWVWPGSANAALECEVKPLGVPFDGTGLQRGADQPLLPFGSPLIFDVLAICGNGASLPRFARFFGREDYHWRARIVADNPLFGRTPWFSQAGNAVTETKLRKR